MLRKKSSRQRLIEKCEGLIRLTLIKDRGAKCEICGKPDNRVGLFHILPKGKYPRMRFNTYNILLVCWFPCHYSWHHDYHKACGIEKRIKELRGENYKDDIKIIDKTQPKLTIAYLNMLYQSLKETGRG